MIAIAVDDEVLMLGALVAAVKASPGISEINPFSSCEDALQFVKDNAVATVTRYADGTQIYEVTFTVTASLEGLDADHITVQLDSELNEIRTLHF